MEETQTSTRAQISRLRCEKGSVGRLRGFIGVLCAILGLKSRIYRVAFHLGGRSPSRPRLREEEKAPADRWTRAVRERKREEGAPGWPRSGPERLGRSLRGGGSDWARGWLGLGLVFPGGFSPFSFYFFLFYFPKLSFEEDF